MAEERGFFAAKVQKVTEAVRGGVTDKAMTERKAGELK